MATVVELDGKRPIESWKKLSLYIDEQGKRQGNIIELTQVFVTIKNPRPLRNRELDTYRNIVGEKIWSRLEKVYIDPKGLSWKPSYIGRLVSSGGVDQLSLIQNRAAKKPGSKVLTCTVLLPTDLRRATYMPAGIPCLVALDFKLRNYQVLATAFFRSQDVARLFPGDLHYLSQIQSQFAKVLSNARQEKWKAGDLVFILTSAHLQRKDLKSVIR